MNRTKFMDLTRLVVSCMKEYNAKLCRKGLLERGIGNKLYIGDFKNLENKFLKEIYNPKSNGNGTKLNGEKEAHVKKEIEKLKTAIKALDNTICTLKNEVSSLIKKEVYDAWLKRIMIISSRFKSMYSDVNNNLYDHLYKVSTKTDQVWNNISTDSKWITDNICNAYMDVKEVIDDFDENDLNGLFEEEKGREVNNIVGNTNERKRKSELNESCKEKVRKRESSVKDKNSIKGAKRNKNFISCDHMPAIGMDEVGEIDVGDFTDLLSKHMN